jgi:hypothetical protein
MVTLYKLDTGAPQDIFQFHGDPHEDDDDSSIIQDEDNNAKVPVMWPRIARFLEKGSRIVIGSNTGNVPIFA